MISTARPGSHPLFMYGVPDAVEAAVRVDRLDEVSAHADRFRHWAEQSRSPEGLALLARCLGLIDARNAGEHFARAIELGTGLRPSANATHVAGDVSGSSAKCPQLDRCGHEHWFG